MKGIPSRKSQFPRVPQTFSCPHPPARSPPGPCRCSGWWSWIFESSHEDSPQILCIFSAKSNIWWKKCFFLFSSWPSPCPHAHEIPWRLPLICLDSRFQSSTGRHRRSYCFYVTSFNPSGARVARLPRDPGLVSRPIICSGHINYYSRSSASCHN